METGTSPGRGRWNTYLERIARKARAAMERILYLGSGNTAGTLRKLWIAEGRPLLEYACELWEGEISRSWEDKLESIQTKFCKAALRLDGNPSALGMRTEMALPSLKTRRRQLKAGWWGRMCNTEHHRLLFQVFRHRHAEVVVGLGPRSHLQSVKHALGALGLSLSWLNRSADLDGWKGRVAWHAQEIERDEFKVAATERKSLDAYIALGLAPTEFVPSYLSDCSNLEGTRLLTACRLGSLQLMGKNAKVMDWPAIGGSCLLCSSGETARERGTLRAEVRIEVEHRNSNSRSNGHQMVVPVYILCLCTV